MPALSPDFDSNLVYSQLWMIDMSRFAKIRWLIPLLLLLVFAGDRFVNGKDGETHHKRLADEFRAIPPFPDSTQKATFDHFSVWNSHKASVGAAYSTPASRSDVDAFYDKELRSLGWSAALKSSSDQAVYCKDDLSASVRYGDANSGYGWTYELTLNWGIPANCG